MVFVTLGSQKFQFNRLLIKIDELIEQGVISEPVFAQIGSSDYLPKNYEYEAFLDRDAFAAKISECDTVITHGGTGVIIDAVKKCKKVIAVPRLARYGEHVDDHQLQLLQQFDDLGIISACYELNALGAYYLNLSNIKFNTYVSNTEVIIESIDEFIQTVGKGLQQDAE